MTNHTDYDERRVLLARSVLAEVFRALGEYRNHIVLVGGWVPGILMREAADQHIGSMDVDIALDHLAISDECYTRISAILTGLGFQADPVNRYQFWRQFTDSDGTLQVNLDLLAAEYGGRGKAARHQHVQDLAARKARGCDLAMQHCVAISLEMQLPGGALADVALRVASVAAFIVMKAFAMNGRRKNKDAYDVVYCLQSYPGGTSAVAGEFAPLASHGLTI